jgi:hypothetical protein
LVCLPVPATCGKVEDTDGVPVVERTMQHRLVSSIIG